MEKLDIDEWFERLKAFAKSEGWIEVETLKRGDWEEYYHDDFTPEEAFWEDQGGG